MEEDAFGISSALEAWQQKVNGVVDGLSDDKIIADGFLISEFSTSKEEAMHDKP